MAAGRPPAVPPTLALAALRPGMLRLAGAEAGMATTNWLAPKDVPMVRDAAARTANWSPGSSSARPPTPIPPALSAGE